MEVIGVNEPWFWVFFGELLSHAFFVTQGVFVEDCDVTTEHRVLDCSFLLMLLLRPISSQA